MFTNFVGIDVSKSKFDLALIKGQDKDHVIQGCQLKSGLCPSCYAKSIAK